jgi:hypothetical protein
VAEGVLDPRMFVEAEWQVTEATGERFALE